MTDELTPAERAVAEAPSSWGDPYRIGAQLNAADIRAVVAAARPHIEAEALRAEAQRKIPAHRRPTDEPARMEHVHTETTRTALVERAAEIEGGSDA